MSGEELERTQEEPLLTGHEGAGGDCLGKALNWSWKGIKIGAIFGSVEGCFLFPIPGSTTPMLFRCLRVIAGRTALGAAAGGVFASAACLSASLRDKDDYMNAFYGGLAAGSVFGITYRRLHVGLIWSFGLGCAIALNKYRHGTYVPPLTIYPQDGRPPRQAFKD